LEKSVPEEPTPDTKSEEIQKLKEEVERLKGKNDTLNAKPSTRLLECQGRM